MLFVTQATTPLDAVRACLEQVSRTLAIARSLVRSGKLVDLTGLEAEVAYVCARVLDLPREEGHAVRPLLIALRSDLDALAAAMPPSEPPHPPRSSPCSGEPEAAP